MINFGTFEFKTEPSKPTSLSPPHRDIHKTTYCIQLRSSQKALHEKPKNDIRASIRGPRIERTYT